MTKSKSGRYLNAQLPMPQRRAQAVAVKPAVSTTSQPVLTRHFGESGVRGESGERWVAWRVDSSNDVERVETMLRDYYAREMTKKREVPEW